MRLTLALLLAIPGILLLATPWLLPLGVLLIWCGWWVYERSGMRDSEALITVVGTLGGLGAIVLIGQAAWQFLIAGLL